MLKSLIYSLFLAGKRLDIGFFSGKSTEWSASTYLMSRTCGGRCLRSTTGSCQSHVGNIQSGLTLIELLIAVSIVGILAAIAYPSYQNYISQGSRAEAKGVLLETAQFMERNYTTNGCYHRNDNSCASAANLTLPFSQAPKTGTATYNVTATYSTTAPCTLGQCYTLSAAPTGRMTGDECGTLTLTHTGTKGQAGGATQAQCWER